jgi:hypothetical protein
MQIAAKPVWINSRVDWARKPSKKKREAVLVKSLAVSLWVSFIE